MRIREWAEDGPSPPVAEQSATQFGATTRRSQWSISRPGSAVMDYGVPGGDRHCTVVYNNWLSSATGEPLSQAELQPVAEWLANGGIRRVVCGHQPHGDTPLALRLPNPVSGGCSRRVVQVEVEDSVNGADAGFGGVVPVVPWRVKGAVVRGFGRGSKTLGIPTANLPPEAWDQVSTLTCVAHPHRFSHQCQKNFILLYFFPNTMSLSRVWPACPHKPAASMRAGRQWVATRPSIPWPSALGGIPILTVRRRRTQRHIGRTRGYPGLGEMSAESSARKRR